MGSPERGNQPAPEHEPRPAYHAAARFPKERDARRAYQRAQDTIFRADCDLSTYRFHLERDWYVAVLGETPPPELAAQLHGILALGEVTEVPPSVLAILTLRREQATKLGPWVERHYRDTRGS